MRHHSATPTALALVLALGLTACGGDDEDVASDQTTASTPATASSDESTITAPPDDASTTAPPDDPSTTAPPDESSTTGPGDESTTTAPTSDTSEADGGTSTTAPPDEEDLPGERTDIYPYEGAALAVVGVGADDTLNVRTGPGTDYDVVVELAPLADGFAATGHNRAVADGTLWAEVLADGRTGWVSTAFIAQPGQTTDVTAELDEVPRAETMVAIAEAVAALRSSGAEGQEPQLTVVDGPTVADVGEITVDVTGYADDAQLGERFHIIAEPDPSGEGFTVRTVEATALCARGATAEGLCT
jgi:hypothetical protein